MLKIRIIPVLLLKDGRMVKSKQFDSLRDVGHPRSTAKIYDAQTADELVFLDIMATAEGRGAVLDVIDHVTEECFVPLTVGGGVRTIEDIRNLLRAGADKVAINSALIEIPGFLKEAAEIFGRANLVASIDYKKVDGENKVFIQGGKKETDFDPITWAKEVEQEGAGEILLNCIDLDGTMNGYDLETIGAVSNAVSIPIIACGGAGSLQDFVDVVEKSGVSAVAAGTIFPFTDQSPIKARHYMKNAGLDVRYGV